MISGDAKQDWCVFTRPSFKRTGTRFQVVVPGTAWQYVQKYLHCSSIFSKRDCFFNSYVTNL